MAKRVLSVIAYGYTLFVVAVSLAKFAFAIFPSGVKNSDKIGHFIAYAVFAFVWALFGVQNKAITYSRSILLSFVWSVFFGILMEVCQWVFTSYRQFDYYDMLANALGSVIGLLFFYSYFVFIKKKEG